MWHVPAVHCQGCGLHFRSVTQCHIKCFNIDYNVTFYIYYRHLIFRQHIRMSRPTQLCVATYHTHTDACMCLVCLFASTYTTAFNYLRRVLCGASSPQPSKTPASSPTWTPTSTETGTVTHLFGTLRISFVSSCITLGKSLFVP